MDHFHDFCQMLISIVLCVELWSPTRFPITVNETFLKNRVFADITKEKMRSYLIRVMLNLMTDVLLTIELWTRTERRAYVKTKAEIGGMHLQTKNCQGFWQPSEAGLGKETSSRAFRGSIDLLPTWFWNFGLKNSERIHFCCINSLSLFYFIMEINTNYIII